MSRQSTESKSIEKSRQHSSKREKDDKQQSNGSGKSSPASDSGRNENGSQSIAKNVDVKASAENLSLSETQDKQQLSPKSEKLPVNAPIAKESICDDDDDVEKKDDSAVVNMIDLSPTAKQAKIEAELPSNGQNTTDDNHEETLLKTDDAEVFTISGTEARNMHMHKLLRQKEQCVVVMSNLVVFEELDDELKDDIKEECERVAKIKDFKVYVQEEHLEGNDEADKTGYGEENGQNVKKTVHFFANCESNEDANKLIAKMNGRYFNQREVQARIYDQELYEQECFRIYC